MITNEQISLLTFVLLYFSQRTDDPGRWTRFADVRLPRLFPWFSQWRWQKGFAQQYESWIQIVSQQHSHLNVYSFIVVYVL